MVWCDMKWQWIDRDGVFMLVIKNQQDVLVRLVQCLSMLEITRDAS